MSEKMAEKLRRFSKISPSIGKPQVAYSACPKIDTDIPQIPKTLAIPLSSIQTTPHRLTPMHKDSKYDENMDIKHFIFKNHVVQKTSDNHPSTNNATK